MAGTQTAKATTQVSGKHNVMVNNNLIEYKVEDIFEDDPDNPENVLMKIPEEIAERMGWQPGDMLKIETENGIMSITKVDNDKK